MFAHRARPTPLKCKIEDLVLPLGEETAVQAVVGSIVWPFRKFKKPRCRETSACGYALHSVCPQLLFFLPKSDMFNFELPVEFRLLAEIHPYNGYVNQDKAVTLDCALHRLFETGSKWS